MKLILYSWDANNEQILADNLIKLGFDVVWFRKACRHYTRDMELAMEMIQTVHREGAEAVVSFNYFPIISMICQTCGIMYYAWVYDCPHFTLYAKQIGSPCNQIGIFDREMARRLEDDYGIYTDEHNYYDLLFPGNRGSGNVQSVDRDPQRDAAESAAVAERDSMEALIGQQCFAYEKDYLRQAVSSEQINLAGLQKSMEEQGLMLGEDYFARPEDILIAAVLEKKVTVEERRRLLTELAELQKKYDTYVTTEDCGKEDAERKYDFRLYTGSDTGALPKLHAHNCGRVDYHTQMPLVFAGSRINLNISLRSIHSGIPLRVLDIMACGGFVLSNRQPEIAEYFGEGVEIATFGSMEECMDKVHYYLAHEEERRRIAEAGQRKVQAAFSYASGLMRLFKMQD